MTENKISAPKIGVEHAVSRKGNEYYALVAILPYRIVKLCFGAPLCAELLNVSVAEFLVRYKDCKVYPLEG